MSTDSGNVGSFATGQEDPQANPADSEVGSFATGQEDPQANPADSEVGASRPDRRIHGHSGRLRGGQLRDRPVGFAG